MLTYRQCVAVLHTGSMGDEPERYIEPIENAAVYARMARNLSNCYTKEGDSKKAKRWFVIGKWLDASITASGLKVGPGP